MFREQNKAFSICAILSRRPAWLILAFACLALNACSSDPKPEPAPVELVENQGLAVDSPEAHLFLEGKRLYQNNLYSVAKDQFESLLVGYPLSPYAEFAEIKIADCHFELREYDVAAGLYESFYKSRPGSRSVAYALLRSGQSFALVNRGIGRDPAPLEKAIGYFNTILERYPNSPYAESARVSKEEMLKRLEAHEKFIIAFYKKQGNLNAAAARESALDSRLAKLAGESMHESTPNESTDSYAPQTLAAEISAPAPLPAPELVSLARYNPNARPAQPTLINPENIPSNTSKTQVANLKSQPELNPNARYRIGAIDCKTGGNSRFFIFLNDTPTEAEINSALEISPNTLKLKLPNAQARAKIFDCFEEQDLELSPNGEITLKTNRNADIVGLQNPSRLLVNLHQRPAGPDSEP